MVSAQYFTWFSVLCMQDMGSAFMGGDVAFLGIFVLKILKTISELVYLGRTLVEVLALQILFHHFWIDFQHEHSLRENLIQGQLYMPQEPLEIVCWHLFHHCAHTQWLVQHVLCSLTGEFLLLTTMLSVIFETLYLLLEMIPSPSL